LDSTFNLHYWQYYFIFIFNQILRSTAINGIPGIDNYNYSNILKI
jgi:hypothetical protein